MPTSYFKDLPAELLKALCTLTSIVGVTGNGFVMSRIQVPRQWMAFTAN